MFCITTMLETALNSIFETKRTANPRAVASASGPCLEAARKSPSWSLIIEDCLCCVIA